MSTARRYLSAFFLALLVMPAQAANRQAVWVDGQNIRSTFMRVYGETTPPIGHVRFCRQYPQACRKDGRGAKRVALTPKAWQELMIVNELVNQMVAPVSDQELYGKAEHWTYPKGKGDCEDYVLMKQKLLAKRGWPLGALLITVVTDETGGGHAVLTVRTDRGDYILDNRRPDILPWNEIPYRFFKRQSNRDPRMWLSLMPRVSDRHVASAGRR